MNLCFVVPLVLALASLGAQAEDAPIILRFSHVVTEDTPKGLAARRFEQLAERYTQGRVDVQVFPDSTLYRDDNEMEALQLGAVEMLAPSLAKFGPLGISGFEVFDLPFLFSSVDDVHKVTEGPIGQELFEALKPRGILGLAYWDNGFKVMSATRPLRVPADFIGMPIRIQLSQVIAAQMDALGATPRMMSMTEVRQALETGWIDGTEMTPSNMFTQGIYTLQPYVTVSDHGYVGYAVIVNAAFWEALPSDIRLELERAMREATNYANSIASTKNAEALAGMAAAGTTQIHVLSRQERAAWIAALWPVHAQMRTLIGSDLVDRVHALLGLSDIPPP